MRHGKRPPSAQAGQRPRNPRRLASPTASPRGGPAPLQPVPSLSRKECAGTAISGNTRGRHPERGAGVSCAEPRPPGPRAGGRSRLPGTAGAPSLCAQPCTSEHAIPGPWASPPLASLRGSQDGRRVRGGGDGGRSLAPSRWWDHVRGGTRESGGLAPLPAWPPRPLRPEAGPSPSGPQFLQAGRAVLPDRPERPASLCDGAFRKGRWGPGFPGSAQGRGR